MTVNGRPPRSPRRGRGERAGIDRDTILAAARSLDPRTLTMQAVADALGVDRKALNHHVVGRESLLEMLAADAVARGFGEIAIADDADWRDACRAFAGGMRRALVAAGVLAAHFRPDADLGVGAIRPAELVVERMVAAGFDEVVAGRALLLLATISTGFARDEAMSARSGGHPQVARFRATIARDQPAGLDMLRRLDESGFDPFDDAQFAFDLETFLIAMEARLHPRRPRAGA